MIYRKALGAVALACMAAIAAPASAATSPPANGKALLLRPLTLVKIDDLDFGAVVPSAALGVVTINASTGVRTLIGGVTGVPSDAGKRAYFAGAGTPNQQVIVTLAQPAQLTSPATDTIPVLGMTLDGPAIRTINASRAFFVGVGGTILIAANQPEGVYTATFTVTANYQ